MVCLRQGAARREGRARRMRTWVACYRRVGQPCGDGGVWSAPTTGPTTAVCGRDAGILIGRRALGRTRPGHVSARVASMSLAPGSTPAATGRLVGACAPSPAGRNDAVDSRRSPTPLPGPAGILFAAPRPSCGCVAAQSWFGLADLFNATKAAGCRERRRRLKQVSLVRPIRSGSLPRSTVNAPSCPADRGGLGHGDELVISCERKVVRHQLLEPSTAATVAPDCCIKGSLPPVSACA